MEVCDHKLLNKLKDRQIKPKAVKCTCTVKCWCNQLSFRAPHQSYERCFSPKEMFEEYGSQMDKDDVAYLTSMLNREFIAN